MSKAKVVATATKGEDMRGTVVLASRGASIVAVVLMGCTPAEKEREAPPVEDLNPWTWRPSNDAELLLARCGNPSQDESTELDEPRPPVPSRIITYESAALRFAYVPGGSAKAGDAPPYKWKLLGVVDTKTGKAVVNLKKTLKKRLPCLLTNP